MNNLDHLSKIEVLYFKVSPGSLLAEIKYDGCDYSIEKDIDDTASPSTWVKSLIKTLNNISSDLDPNINRENILDGLLFGICLKLEERFKGGISSILKPFGLGGVQQYLLDIRFLANVCQSYMSSKTDDSFMGLCNKALKSFLKENKDKANKIKVSEW